MPGATRASVTFAVRTSPSEQRRVKPFLPSCSPGSVSSCTFSHAKLKRVWWSVNLTHRDVWPLSLAPGRPPKATWEVLPDESISLACVCVGGGGGVSGHWIV